LPTSLPTHIRRVSKEAATLQITIPAAIAQDARFPFKNLKREFQIRIDGDHLIVEEAEGETTE